jgi:hypothetical protein
MYFIQANADKTGTWSYQRYEASPCKAEDLTLAEFESKQLYICGPYEKLSLMGNWNTNPTKSFGFAIDPKDESESENF